LLRARRRKLPVPKHLFISTNPHLELPWDSQASVEAAQLLSSHSSGAVQAIQVTY